MHRSKHNGLWQLTQAANAVSGIDALPSLETLEASQQQLIDSDCLKAISSKDLIHEEPEEVFCKSRSVRAQE